MREKRQLKKIAAKSVKLSAPSGKIDQKNVGMVIKRLKNLPSDQAIYVISKYLKGLKRKKMESTVVVESAIPLLKKQLDQIYAKLSEEFIIQKLENKLNPDILGGIKIRIGDMILDYSLQNKLTQVGKAIVS